MICTVCRTPVLSPTSASWPIVCLPTSISSSRREPDPPIAWSRHRLAQEVIEIRQSDLALDTVDSAVLLERITGRSLEPDWVATLVARTEGWAAGLQLAGMTLRSYHDPSEFVAQFSGDDRLVADYLSEEVLSAQADERRRLLLILSVLDKMSRGAGQRSDRRVELTIGP